MSEKKSRQELEEELEMAKEDLQEERKKARLSRAEAEAKVAWRDLVQVMEGTANGRIELKDVPRTAKIGYSEMRAIRFAYCVLNWPPQKIALATGRRIHSINKLIVSRRWVVARKRIDEDIIKRATKKMAHQVESVVGLTTQALTRWLTDVVKNDTPLSTKEAKLISDIGANFHRILQLTKNKPTSITQTVNDMSDEEAMDSFLAMVKKAKEDPMFDMDSFLESLGISKDGLTPEEKKIFDA